MSSWLLPFSGRRVAAVAIAAYTLVMAVWIFGPLTESHGESFVSAMWIAVGLVHIGIGLLLRESWSFLIALIPLLLAYMVGVVPAFSDLAGVVPSPDGGIQAFFVVAPSVPIGACLVAVAAYVARRGSRERRYPNR